MVTGWQTIDGLLYYFDASGAMAVGEIGDPVRDGVLARNEYGGGDRQYELLVEGLENGEEQVKVTVPERKMSDAEVQRELPGIMEYLKGEILGGNSSLSKVQSDLNLTRTLVKYGLSVEWESGDPETVSDMGLIGSEMPESGKTVTLRAGLMNGSSVTWVEIPVTVFPETETLGETFSAFLGKLADRDYRPVKETKKDEAEVRVVRMWNPSYRVNNGQYVEAPRSYTLRRVMERMDDITVEEAHHLITKTDKYRADYYKYYTGGNYWTNPVNYDLTFNNARLGDDRCVKLVLECMKLKFGADFKEYMKSIGKDI